MNISKKKAKTDNFHFGKKIHDIRVLQGFSQSTVADSLDIAQKTYSRWEQQAYPPKQEYVNKLAAFYEVDPKELMPETSEKDLVRKIANKGRDLVNSQYLFIINLLCFIVIYPPIWTFIHGLCQYYKVAEDPTFYLRALAIPISMFLIWYGVTRVKSIGK